MAEQHDDGMVERIGSPEHGVHQRAADAEALVLGEDAERAEPERRACADRAVVHTTWPTTVTACILRDQGERRDPSGVGAQVAHEGDLGRRAGEPGPGERRGVHRVDGLDVVDGLAADEHVGSLPDGGCPTKWVPAVTSRRPPAASRPARPRRGPGR